MSRIKFLLALLLVHALALSACGSGGGGGGEDADTTSPVINIAVSGACTDDNGLSLVNGLDGVGFTVTDENPLSVSCTVDDLTSGTSHMLHSCTSPVDAGNLINNHVYRITVQAFDGTNTATDFRTFKADANGPIVDFISPISGGAVTLTGSGPFTGEVTIWDIDYPVPFTPEISLDNIQVTATSVPLLPGPPGRPLQYQYTIPASVTSGTHTVKVESTDCIGHTSTPSAQFTVVRN